MEVIVKWLMVMAVTGSLVILLQFQALVRTRSALMDVLRQSRTYQTQDTAKTPTSDPSSRVPR